MAVSDLTGTSWRFDRTTLPYTSAGTEYQIDGEIITANHEYNLSGYMGASSNGLIYAPLNSAGNFAWVGYNVTVDQDSFTGDWEVYDHEDREPLEEALDGFDMAISGGSDVTNATLIAWLEANATQVVDGNTYTLSNSLSNASAEDITFIIQPDEGYALPDTVTVTNGTLVSYNKATGEVVVSGASAEISVECEAVAPSGYTVTVSGVPSYDHGRVYDGTSTDGIDLGVVTNGTYTITSGHLCAYYSSQVQSSGTVSGGVALNVGLSDAYQFVYDVTADGTISNVYWSCFVEGTKITLADGTEKNVEDVTFDDELLVWDFYEGKFGTAKPMWIAPEHTASYYYRVELENGTILKLVGSGGKSHRLYDFEAKEFAYPQDMGRHHAIDNEYRGWHIEKIERVDEEVKYYNIITEKHYNLYAEGILTSCRISNRYGIAQPFSRTMSQMKYDTNDVRMTEEEVQAYIDALEKGD